MAGFPISGGLMHRLFFWLLVGVLHAGVAVAQAPRAQPAFPSFHASFTSGTSAQPPTTRLYTPSDTAEASKRTYWLEGGVIGAVVLGVTSVFVYEEVAKTLCSDTGGAGCTDFRAATIVGGTALGFLVGSLIGQGHTKAEPVAASAPD